MREKRLFVFGDLNSADLGLDVSGTDTFDFPERDVSKVSVPGRSGDLIIDNGRYSNVSISYSIKMFNRHDTNEFLERFNRVCTVLKAMQRNYFRLEDSYQPDIFRMAQVDGKIDPNVVENSSGPVYAEFDLNLSCKPQLFLKSGENTFTFTTSGNSIYNPTDNDSKPFIKIYLSGSGTLGVGDETVTIAEGASAFIVLDCYSHMVYEGTANRASIVTLTDWPVLTANGLTGITFSGDITKVDIIPRWYR